jgi:hypothetical protein
VEAALEDVLAAGEVLGLDFKNNMRIFSFFSVEKILGEFLGPVAKLTRCLLPEKQDR